MNNTPMECSECGMVVEEAGDTPCPKCDGRLHRQCVDDLHVIDVAHSGEDWYVAEKKIERGVDYVLQHGLKGLKVIHGYGSKPGHTSLIGSRATHVLRRMAHLYSGRLTEDHNNPGAHILYLNRG